MTASHPGEHTPLPPTAQLGGGLEATTAAPHASATAAQSGAKANGGPHGQQGGKRTFRRKAGG